VKVANRAPPLPTAGLKYDRLQVTLHPVDDDEEDRACGADDEVNAPYGRPLSRKLRFLMTDDRYSASWRFIADHTSFLRRKVAGAVDTAMQTQTD
jgi:hypothetical protein